MFAPHKALDGCNGFFGVGDGLALGRIPDLNFSVRQKGDDGRGRAATFAVGNDNVFVAFHHGYTRVGGSEVNADDLFHRIRLSFPLFIQEQCQNSLGPKKGGIRDILADT